MKIYIKKAYKDQLTTTIIDKVLLSLGITKKYSISYEDGYGRYLLIEDGKERIYVIISREQADARNAFLAQYISTVFHDYLNDSSKHKKICIYLLDVSSKAKASFIVDTYRCAKTLGMTILNEADLHISIPIYTDFHDWKNAKKNRQEFNSGNFSSYAIEDEEGYTIFGKLYGANGKESVLFACLIAQIAKANNRQVKYIQVKEHDTENVSSTDKAVLEHFGIQIEPGSIVLERAAGKPAKTTCRDQDAFKFNLLEKFGSKKCLLCGCDIESTIIASHIHRVTDIDKSSLSAEDKRKQAIDANNGFWLCANHDKLFEFGLITFNVKGDLVINPFINKDQIDFIKYITNETKLKDVYINSDLLDYLMIHNKRVNLGVS